MNPWAWLLIALAALAIFIGVTGSQNSVYAFITGHRPNAPMSSATSGNSSVASPSSSSHSTALPAVPGQAQINALADAIARMLRGGK